MGVTQYLRRGILYTPESTLYIFPSYRIHMVRLSGIQFWRIAISPCIEIEWPAVCSVWTGVWNRQASSSNDREWLKQAAGKSCVDMYHGMRVLFCLLGTSKEVLWLRHIWKFFLIGVCRGIYSYPWWLIWCIDKECRVIFYRIRGICW